MLKTQCCPCSDAAPPVLQARGAEPSGASPSDVAGEEDVVSEFLSLQPEELWDHMTRRNGTELQVTSFCQPSICLQMLSNHICC